MIILDLGIPPTAPLSINQERRMHWAAARRETRPWRDAACWLAMHAKLAALVAGQPAAVTVALPVRGHHRRDPANYYPTVKAVIDGLVLAGVWPDDTPDWVTVTEPVLVDDQVQANAEVRLELRDPATRP